jgi:glucans biosynthesis protein
MSGPDRRSFLAMLAGLCGTGGAAFAQGQDAQPHPRLTGGEAFSPEWLQAEARRLADAPYAERRQVPKAWRDLTYDEYQLIWFHPDRGLWSGSDLPFRVDFFHPGLYFPRPVEINVVEDGIARQVAFDFALFDHTDNIPDLPMDDTLGYSGLRLRAQIEGPEHFREFMVFQGASYFRAIARGDVYGLSARGLALNTGDPRGEEFPDFTCFWIERPAPGAHNIIVHALMDSPSVAGAYSFDVTPGDPTVVDVSTMLFAREKLDHLGLAPLTSMFFFDETNRSRFDDFRPAVHDSDGLSIWNGAGEMLWRPLANPKDLQISSFVDENPRGFGLMQRSRKFSQFADLVAQYHKRPSLWIEPGEDWGKGSVSLVEIPADREIYDNIVAYWRPRETIPAGGQAQFSYRMTWGGELPQVAQVAPVINTRMGARFGGGYIATVDFGPHEALPGDPEAVEIMLRGSAGEVSGGILERNPETGGLRLAFTFDPSDARQVELRAQLLVAGRTVTEVWLYRWTA